MPLLGQALVQQLVTPVSVNALAALFDSYWPIAPVLDFTTNYVTLDKDTFHSALNTIIELDDYDALQFVAGTSDLTKKQDSTKEGQIPSPSGNVTLQVTNKPADPEKKDALDIYLLPYRPFALSTKKDQSDRHKDLKYLKAVPQELKEERRRLQLWARLLRIYLGTQPQDEIRCKEQGDWPSAIQGPKDLQTPNQFKALYDAKKNFNAMPKDAGLFHEYLIAVDAFLRTLDEQAGLLITSDGDFTKTIACLRDWVELRTAAVPYKKAGER